MIDYSGAFAFARFRGSVAPKAFRWALPCSCLVVFYKWIFTVIGVNADEYEASSAETTMYSLFTSILGFLIVFRAQLAYGRYWEGITLVERACGVWLNGVSNLIAFCSANAEKQVEVAAFQHLLSRLFSLLLSISLCEISRLDDEHFPPLSIDGINPESLDYLYETSAKQKVVLQWIQRLVVENERTGVIDIAPPILSRVFQEFSIGIVHLIDAQKITTVPFPFQFAQMVWIMISFFSVIPVPLLCALYLQWSQAIVFTFFIIFAFMSVHYISIEIEQPFGDGPNDLPIENTNLLFKQALMTLLEPEAQQTPILVKTTEEIMQHVAVCRRIARERDSSTGMFPVSSRSGGIEPPPKWRISLFKRKGSKNLFDSEGAGVPPRPRTPAGMRTQTSDDTISAHSITSSRQTSRDYRDPQDLVLRLPPALRGRKGSRLRNQARQMFQQQQQAEAAVYSLEGDDDGLDWQQQQSSSKASMSRTLTAGIEEPTGSTGSLPTISPSAAAAAQRRNGARQEAAGGGSTPTGGNTVGSLNGAFGAGGFQPRWNEPQTLHTAPPVVNYRAILTPQAAAGVAASREGSGSGLAGESGQFRSGGGISNGSGMNSPRSLPSQPGSRLLRGANGGSSASVGAGGPNDRSVGSNGGLLGGSANSTGDRPPGSTPHRFLFTTQPPTKRTPAAAPAQSGDGGGGGGTNGGNSQEEPPEYGFASVSEGEQGSLQVTGVGAQLASI